jgi:DNA ligase (NAD+)
LGEKTIAQLYDMNLVKTPADLYDLRKEDILKLEGFKDTSTKNLLAGIEASKSTPFESVLFALGIRFVGKTVAEKLARHFKSLDQLATASLEDLLGAPEVGDRIAASVLAYFRDRNNIRELERLRKSGLQFISTHQAPVLVSDVLSGKTFVVSGTFEKYERDEIKEVIIAHGGKVLSGVSAKLDFLVAGDNMGPAKREKAEKLKVPIITEAEFQKMLKG